MQPKPLRILISPLDWGLGHATRCIPIIRQLLKSGHKITLAGNGRSLVLLEKEFPLLKTIELQGFSPSYPKSGKMLLHLLLLLPKFIFSILREHQQLSNVLSTNSFDVIISDNRYGLFNKKIRSVIITHQVMIKLPNWLKLAEYPIYVVSRFMISRFNECWIPDTLGIPGLSGDLSHKYTLPRNACFVGPLTRFSGSGYFETNCSGEIRITAIISGPEPQRSLFEELITKQLSDLNLTSTILSGRPDFGKTVDSVGCLTIISHLETHELEQIIAVSTLVICRSGYSSIMDLAAMGSKALFVPTPGQTEQIYLAELHQQLGIALWRPQDKLNLKIDIPEALKYKGYIQKSAMPDHTFTIPGF